MVQNYQGQNAVRRYLLKQLSGAEQEAFELRLLTDDALSEELEIVEDELIDEYLADELSTEERAGFEEIFLAHPERRRKLQEGEILKRHFDTLPQPAPTPQRFGFLPDWIRQPYSNVFGIGGELVLSPIGAMAAVLVVSVAVFLAWRAFIYQSDLDKGLLALNEAYRQERPIQARVSNLDYAQFIETRSSHEPAPVNTFERDRAERFLSDAFKEDADAETYHALGKFYLLKRDIDKAIENLEQARNADPNDAQIYADLGAAYFEKAKQESDTAKPDGQDPADGKELEDLGRSLDYLKQALELNPNLLEALFNRGLVHEKQELYHQAEADWRAYLEKDSNSQWAVEARDRLKSVEGKKDVGLQKADDSLETFLRAYRVGDDEAAWQIFKRNHQLNGNKITSALVDNFLAEDVSGNTSENLQALNYLGQLELRKVEDAYTSDLARFYSAATTQTKTLLAQARKEMDNGFKLSSKSEVDAAMESFLRARTAFEKAGDVPELLATDAEIAHAATVQPDLAKAGEVLKRIIPICESKRYKWWRAQSLAVRAHLNSNLNNYSEAISDSNQSLQLFQELEDMLSVTDIFLQVASLHLFLNDNKTSFSYLRRALTQARKERAPPIHVWRIHTGTSLTLTALRLYRAALDYQNEALQLVLTSPSPVYLSRSYQYLGRTYGLLRQFELGLQNVRLAYEQGRPLANERLGQNMMAFASLTLGDIYRASGDPNSAVGAYEESSRLYDGLKFAHYSYVAHKGKFLSYLALNNDVMAQQELQIVLDLFGEYRQKILDERQKSFFFDREQDIYDLAIEFTYFRLGDQHRAFDYSEMCRARNLHELMHHGTEVMQSASGLNLRASKDGSSQEVVPLTLTEIQQQLPEQVQIVQYAVLEKKLLIWHITRSGVVPKSVDIESAKLREAVETALRQLAQRDEQGSAASLKSLYNLIIEPVREKLDPNLVLCFIPDKSLHYVPFSALLSDRSGHYLVQDYRLMTSPSATILIDRTKQAGARTAVKEEHLLAVGNPAFDRAVNPNLANLSGARREAEQIALNYLSPRILVTQNATRRAIMDEIPRADVAHFAAHYEVDPRSTLSSKLLLAYEPGEPAHSGLSSADIYQINLPRTRLVILSGCRTGIEQQFGGEGPVGFARSFLVAGVPVVVASLWPVDSDATSELMIAFHRFRRFKHLPTAEALMSAQQEIMARENYRHPYYWAGFTAIGGYSDF